MESLLGKRVTANRQDAKRDVTLHRSPVQGREGVDVGQRGAPSIVNEDAAQCVARGTESSGCAPIVQARVVQP